MHSFNATRQRQATLSPRRLARSDLEPNVNDVAVANCVILALEPELARLADLGIRAQRREIFRLVLIQGLILAMVGALVGIGAAIGVTRYLGSLLYGIRATDPATFVIIAFLLIAVALLACYIPSRRATRVDPLVALRYE